jgi:lipopolysaccharide export system protein LptA
VKYFIILLLIVSSSFSNEIKTETKKVDVDIKSDKFLADRAKNIIIFTGNVVMEKGSDLLKADKLTVHTKLTENNETVVKKYVAIGNVDLKMKKNESITYAKGNSIIYDVDKQEYLIEGNGYLEDTLDSKIIKGERIYLDNKTQKTKIDGDKNKPVEFKFKMEETK